MKRKEVNEVTALLEVNEVTATLDDTIGCKHQQSFVGNFEAVEAINFNKSERSDNS